MLLISGVWYSYIQDLYYEELLFSSMSLIGFCFITQIVPCADLLKDSSKLREGEPTATQFRKEVSHYYPWCVDRCIARITKDSDIYPTYILAIGDRLF